MLSSRPKPAAADMIPGGMNRRGGHPWPPVARNQARTGSANRFRRNSHPIRAEVNSDAVAASSGVHRYATAPEYGRPRGAARTTLPAPMTRWMGNANDVGARFIAPARCPATGFEVANHLGATVSPWTSDYGRDESRPYGRGGLAGS